MRTAARIPSPLQRPGRMRFRAGRASTLSCVLVAALLGAGCKDDDEDGPTDPLPPPPPGQELTGTYTLRTLNGQTLPVITRQVGQTTTEVTGGSVTFTANGNFSGTTVVRTTTAGQAQSVTETATGTYTRNGSAMIFQESDGRRYNGTLTGDNLSVVGPVPPEGSGNGTFGYTQ